MAIRDVIIIGAGPSGLSAAIAAKQQNLDYQVLEQGVLVNSIGRFPPQMVFFTTPELLEIGGLPFVSPYEKPTRVEALKYYRKVVDAFDLRIAFGEKVLAVAASPGASMGSEGAIDPTAAEAEAPRFAVSTRSKLGGQRVHHARNVIFAIGYYDHPVLIGVPGEAMAHVRHDYAEPYPHYRQNVSFRHGCLTSSGPPDTLLVRGQAGSRRGRPRKEFRGKHRQYEAERAFSIRGRAAAGTPPAVDSSKASTPQGSPSPLRGS